MRTLVAVALASAALLAPGARAQDQPTQMSAQPLAQYDYSAELSVRGFNTIMKLASNVIEEHFKTKRKGPEKVSITMAQDFSVKVEGIATVARMGRVNFLLDGQIELKGTNPVDYVLTGGIRFQDANGNGLKDLSLSLVKPFINAFILLLTQNAKVNEYMTVDTNMAFMPGLGTVAGLFGAKKIITIKLKPAGLPWRALSGLDTVYGAKRNGRLVVQGVLKAE
jgi:hypothetical protein